MGRCIPHVDMYKDININYAIAYTLNYGVGIDWMREAPAAPSPPAIPHLFMPHCASSGMLCQSSGCPHTSSGRGSPYSSWCGGSGLHGSQNQIPH